MRRWSRLVAMVLLFATMRGLPHLAQDDAECLPAAVGAYGDHHETEHSLLPAGLEAQEHCAICHWTRSLRSPRAEAAGWVSQFTPPSLVYGGADRPLSAPVLESLPARAPPASLL